jgi:hypothetical protein
MSTLASEKPVLPNEVWAYILRYLPLDTLWHSTRPVCGLFYQVSVALVKSHLVDGSLCELRHYISFKEDLLSESLHYPTEHTDYQLRILEREGHSDFSEILLWCSPFASRVNPQTGSGIPTVNYQSADGKKCFTMAVFGQQDRASSSTSGQSAFHCRRTGCGDTDEDEGLDGGHICLAGCWHVHYSRIDRIFCVTIPLASLLRIYLRLERARNERITERSYALPRKRWNPWSRHGVSASLADSPLVDFDNALNSLLAMNSSDSGVDEEETDLPGSLFEWLDDEEGYLNGLFDVETGVTGSEG